MVTLPAANMGLRWSVPFIWLLGCSEFGLVAPADDAGSPRAFVVPHEMMPQYVLSNPRFDTGRRGQKQIVVDFVKQGGPGSTLEIAYGFRVGGTSQLDKFNVLQSLDAKSGTLRVTPSPKSIDKFREFGVELWLQYDLVTGMGKDTSLNNGVPDVFAYRFKISNSVMIGPAAAKVQVRPPTGEEQRRLAVWLKRETPPSELPAGYVSNPPQEKLVPGMPILYNKQGTWIAGEVIEDSGGRSLIIRLNEKSTELGYIRAQWVAVRRSDLELAQGSPSAFQSSLMNVPGEAVALPENLRRIQSHRLLVAGTPIYVVAVGSFSEAVVLEKPEWTTVSAQYTSSWGKRKFTTSYSEVYVTAETLAILEGPSPEAEIVKRNAREAAAAEAAKLAAEAEKTSPKPEHTTPQLSDGSSQSAAVVETPAPPRKVTRYRPTIPVPSGMQVVTDDMPLTVGTKLGCCSQRRWKPVTVLKVHDDGTLHCTFDGYSSAWDADFVREDLIIANQVLRKLKLAVIAGAKSEVREWTDSTGEFRITARIENVTSEIVTLKKEDTSMVRVPISRLSAEDQEFLKQAFPLVK